MLAFETFLKNKNSKSGNPKSLKPIKKIIYNNKKWLVDSETIEDYGSDISEKFRPIQEWLSMPLTTSDSSKLNLPDFRTSTAQPNPYFEIYGILKINKSSKSVLTLSIGKKPNTLEYSFDVSSGTSSKKSSNVKLKLDRKNYKIAGTSLFELYVNSGLINGNGNVDEKTFEEIATAFFNFTKKSPLENPKTGTISFSVFVIPSNKTITYEPSDSTKLAKRNASKSFIDAFGNSSLEYASSSTKTAKFLSFDDKAFTLNCKQKHEFYENIGIGNSSLDKIYFPKDQTFSISGLNWVFTDIASDYFKFKEIRRGILSQLYNNYKIISKDKSTYKKNAVLKVICYKVQQAKQEILIDENLTMDKMEKMFSTIKEDEIPFNAIETLIESVGKNTLWNNYLYAVKNFLSENKIPKHYLLAIFSRMLRQQIHDWIKLTTTTEQRDFFINTDFCLKCLSKSFTNTSIMNPNEEFAYRVGQIARNYIDFKQKIGEESNSLRDILTYSKYDRDRLRFVIQRVSIGINLAKTNDHDITEITKKVSSLQPKEEILDNEAQRDFSYFFYKGYYTTQEVIA
jgi:hypothetical protein